MIYIKYWLGSKSVCLPNKGTEGIFLAFSHDNFEFGTSTGYHKLYFTLSWVKKSLKDGGGTKYIEIWLSAVDSELIIGDIKVFKKVLSNNYRYSIFKSVSKSDFARAKLAGIPIDELFNDLYMRDRYAISYDYSDDYINLDRAVVYGKSRYFRELFAIDLFIDENNNWHLSPSKSNVYVFTDGFYSLQNYTFLNNTGKNSKKDIKPIDYSTDYNFSALYNAVLNSFNLEKMKPTKGKRI